MRFTFPARYCEGYKLATSESEFIKIVEATLGKLDWKPSLTAKKRIQVQIPFNFWSFGEKMTVELQNGEISVCSECVSPFQCFDWGKNKLNVKTFLDTLEEAKENLLANRLFETAKSFDDEGVTPLEKVIAEIK